MTMNESTQRGTLPATALTSEHAQTVEIPRGFPSPRTTRHFVGHCTVCAHLMEAERLSPEGDII